MHLNLPCWIAFWVLPGPDLCAHRGSGEQASRTTLVPATPARVCRAIRFLGSVSRRDCSLFPGDRDLHRLLFARLICDSNRLRIPPALAARIPASVVRSYEGLHCEPRPAPNLYDYFKQRTMATGANGAAGAFGNGPSAGYILILFLFTGFLAMLTGNVENAKTVITYLLLFSRLIWIKFNMNMPKFLTQCTSTTQVIYCRFGNRVIFHPWISRSCSSLSMLLQQVCGRHGQSTAFS